MFSSESYFSASRGIKFSRVIGLDCRPFLTRASEKKRQVIRTYVIQGVTRVGDVSNPLRQLSGNGQVSQLSGAGQLLNCQGIFI